MRYTDIKKTPEIQPNSNIIRNLTVIRSDKTDVSDSGAAALIYPQKNDLDFVGVNNFREDTQCGY